MWGRSPRSRRASNTESGQARACTRPARILLLLSRRAPASLRCSSQPARYNIISSNSKAEGALQVQTLPKVTKKREIERERDAGLKWGERNARADSLGLRARRGTKRKTVVRRGGSGVGNNRGKRESVFKLDFFVVQRYAFPFVLTAAEVDAETDPFAFPPLPLPAPALVRGFLDVLASAEARGALSFITILAWISSNLEAFTFLGQNRVTNLRSAQHIRVPCTTNRKARLTSIDVVAIAPDLRQLLAFGSAQPLSGGRSRPGSPSG
jgi:hypothetical protein